MKINAEIFFENTAKHLSTEIVYFVSGNEPGFVAGIEKLIITNLNKDMDNLLV